MIPNFSLAGSFLSRKHRLAKFFNEQLEWTLVDQSSEQSETEWLCIDVAGYKIINVYKPPPLRNTPTDIPTFPHRSQHAGDFNRQHVNCGYNTTSPDGENLSSKTAAIHLELLHKPKGVASFCIEVNEIWNDWRLMQFSKCFLYKLRSNFFALVCTFWLPVLSHLEIENLFKILQSGIALFVK